MSQNDFFVFSINLSGLQYIIKKQGILANLMQVIGGKLIGQIHFYFVLSARAGGNLRILQSDWFREWEEFSYL